MAKSKTPTSPSADDVMAVLLGLSQANPWIAEYMRCALNRVGEVYLQTYGAERIDPAVIWLEDNWPRLSDQFYAMWKTGAPDMADAPAEPEFPKRRGRKPKAKAEV